MIPLKAEYTAGGARLTVIDRINDVVIAECRVAYSTCYEVWHVRKGTERVIEGQVIPASEHPPNAEQWGKYGWTYRTLEEARRKQSEVVERITNAEKEGGRK